MKDEKQREYFRVRFPVPYRPSFMMELDTYEVVDVSEYGVKVRTDQNASFMVDEYFMASMTFPDGRMFDLSGQVVRVENDCAGLELSTPLPLRLIRSEALYVIQNYSEN